MQNASKSLGLGPTSITFGRQVWNEMTKIYADIISRTHKKCARETSICGETMNLLQWGAKLFGSISEHGGISSHSWGSIYLTKYNNSTCGERWTKTKGARWTGHAWLDRTGDVIIATFHTLFMWQILVYKFSPVIVIYYLKFVLHIVGPTINYDSVHHIVALHANCLSSESGHSEWPGQYWTGETLIVHTSLQNYSV